MIAALRSIVGEVSARDIVAVLGLGLVGVGLYMAWPPLAPLGLGAVLVGVAVFGMR